LDKHTLGALHHGYSLGSHSPILFSCGSNGLLPSQKKETKFPLGIPSSTFSALWEEVAHEVVVDYREWTTTKRRRCEE
jgi:hypothetical protein